MLQESTDQTPRATVLPSITLMGRSWEEYTDSDSDSESEGAVLDEGYELHGENYDPVSDAEHDGYYWDD